MLQSSFIETFRFFIFESGDSIKKGKARREDGGEILPLEEVESPLFILFTNGILLSFSISFLFVHFLSCCPSC